MANSEVNHQLDTQHIQTQHSHELDSIELFDGSSADQHSIKDCHHCGHCSGAHAQWFAGEKNTQTSSPSLVSNQYVYLEHPDKSVIEQLVRPPIS